MASYFPNSLHCDSVGFGTKTVPGPGGKGTHQVISHVQSSLEATEGSLPVAAVRCHEESKTTLIITSSPLLTFVKRIMFTNKTQSAQARPGRLGQCPRDNHTTVPLPPSLPRITAPNCRAKAPPTHNGESSYTIDMVIVDKTVANNKPELCWSRCKLYM